MRETIILAPGCSSSEMLRTLALYGRPTFGYRITAGTELAELALTRSGLAMPGRYITARELAVITYSLMCKTEYFRTVTWQDAEQLSAALQTLRGLITENEQETMEARLPEGPFQEKNMAVLQVYLGCRALLRSKGLYDSIDMLRYAIVHAEPMEADYLCLREYPLTPLEQKLLEQLSGGSFRVTSAAELFGTALPKEPVISEITSAYGITNELEHVFADIQKHRQSYDSCVIAVTAPAQYALPIFGYARQHQLPVTFGCGLPVACTAPARLLYLWNAWEGIGHCGKDALTAMLKAPEFSRGTLAELLAPAGYQRKQLDSLVDYAGALRLSSDASRNAQVLREFQVAHIDCPEEAAMLPVLRAFASELELGCSGFIRRYSAVRSNAAERAADLAALQYIDRILGIWDTYGTGALPFDMVSSLLGGSVCVQPPMPGAVHVVTLEKLPAAMRKNVYVLGLAASMFPGTPSESPFLLDKDLLLFGSGAQLPTSDRLIADRRCCLNQMLELAGALGSRIALSWPSYQLADLKEDNPSSCLYALAGSMAGDAAAADALDRLAHKAGFFDEASDSLTLAGRAYAAGTELCGEPLPVKAYGYPGEQLLSRSYSPTAIERFFQCGYQFFLRHILALPEEQEDRPTEIITAADRGSLIHDALSLLDGTEAGETACLQSGEAAFDRYLKRRPPVRAEEAELEKQQYMDMLRAAVTLQHGCKVITNEGNAEAMHSTGIHLHGRYDSLVQLQDGRYVLIDYKTGRNIIHSAEEPETCLQLLLYAYMLEQNGIAIDHGAYRYLRYGRSVQVQLNDDTRALTDALLQKFHDALERGDFAPAADQSTCSSCSYAAVCRAAKEEENADE